MKKSNLICTAAIGLLFLTAETVCAQPGSGIRLGEQTVLVPSYSGSINYDDNVTIRSRALGESGQSADKEQTYYTNSAALTLLNLGASSRLNGRAFYSRDDYPDASILDGENYGAGAGWDWTSANAKSKLLLEGSFQRAIDREESNVGGFGGPNLEVQSVEDRVERDVARANVELQQDIGTTLGTALIFGYTDIDYEEQTYFDRTATDYAAELNYQATNKTRPYARAGITFVDDQGFEDDAEKPFFLLGVRSRPTEKLNLDLGVGYEEYTRTPVGGTELENSRLKWTARVRYSLTTKSTLVLSSRNGYDSVSSTNNTSRETTSLSLAFLHELTDQFSHRIIGSWRYDEYLSPVTANGVTYDEERDTFSIGYRVDYQTVRPWLSLFAKANYEDGSSKIPGNEYDQTELSLGLNLTY